jgi:hypothetical protein
MTRVPLEANALCSDALLSFVEITTTLTVIV